MKRVTKPKTRAAPRRAKKECGTSLPSASNCCSVKGCGTCAGTAYTLGFIGALVYYISTATTFWIGVLGFLKAIVWPGLVVFELMKFLGM